MSEAPLYLHAAGVGLVLDCRGPRLPRILHWGRELTGAGDDDLAALALGAAQSSIPNGLDAPVPVTVLPEHATGWFGLPGLRGHRDGADWSPLFETTGTEVRGGAEVVTRARDAAAGLELTLHIELAPSGLLRLRAILRNTDATRVYTVDGLGLALPVPPQATELLDLTGRWGRERAPQRHAFTTGTHLRDGRRGRTGTDATLVLVAGETGLGFRSGQAWGVHVAWSGNHRAYAERVPTGEALIGGGELVHGGEVRLAPGETYETPVIYAAYGDGLDALAARFHDFLRARPGHPRGPRPVVYNTWEAVYFDHDLDRLRTLADAAAEVGAERFVLDDGWFRGRRDDSAGLGDWYVDGTVWPDGLHPIVDHVRARGMQFGLWVEPEMVNPDSDLARDHPDWIMATGDRLPPLSRRQQVLDLRQKGAYEYLLERLDALVGEYRIDYLKWDHNRDLVDAGVHGQTLAVYRLLDELRSRHPGLEIESCSSGGGRVDLGILERTDRVWASDCIDALERQRIQRWTALLLPPELIGSHVGAARAHTTGRTQDLPFRAGTALFGHFGIEWDLTAASPAERAALRGWVELYKSLRGWLHRGRVVRGDHPDPALWIHGIVASDADQALFALVATETGVAALPGRVRLPGLAPDTRYRVRPLPPGDAPSTVGAPPPWLRDGLVTTGQILGEAGVTAPVMHPEQLLLLHVEAIS
ncbi:alpha-galactosidase [Actinomycetes bacterium KLBMP 9797]